MSKRTWQNLADEEYYIDENSNSIRRKDILQYKKYVGDYSLTTKEIKKLRREERRKHVRNMRNEN